MEDFNSVVDKMKLHGVSLRRKNIRFRVPNAEVVFDNAMIYFLGLYGKKYQKLKEYSGVIDWLRDNECRGLFMHGSAGRGKSVIARNVIPAILFKYCGKVVNVCDLDTINTDIDQKLQCALLTLDDIGLEPEANIYGNKRMAVSEYLDNAEKNGNVLIITTNLSEHEIFEKYGLRGLDRIVSTTKRVRFEGDSLRD